MPPPVFSVKALDHVVLTVRSIPATVAFYTNRLGMKHETFVSGVGEERHALKFGAQKINLHLSGAEFEPKAAKVQPGSADLCFITEHRIDDVLSGWKEAGIEVSGLRGELAHLADSIDAGAGGIESGGAYRCCGEAALCLLSRSGRQSDRVS
ncbi:hypothetical protein EPUL_005914, partial [Erysiphe pulchra]